MASSVSMGARVKENAATSPVAPLAAPVARLAERGRVDPVSWCCGAVGMLACLTMIGWVFHIPILTMVIPHYASMKPNTAACLGMVAVACWMQRRPRLGARAWGGMAAVLAIAGTLALAVGTLLEDVFHTPGWLDGIILQVPASRVGEPSSGRMAVGTAVCLTMAALGLLILDRLPKVSVWLFGLVGGDGALCTDWNCVQCGSVVWRGVAAVAGAEHGRGAAAAFDCKPGGKTGA